MYTILIVEDFNDTRAMLATYFASRGYTVLAASNGWDAVKLAVGARPDVILMDLNLPTIDGFEACAMLRGRQDMERVPIIAITAHDTPDARADAEDAGITAYVTKPFQLLELERTVTRCLARNDA